MPISLNRWITSRTVSSSAWTSRAITGTRVPAGRGQHHHRPPQPHRRTGPPAHDLLQPLTLLIGQPAHTDRFCHRHSLTAARHPTAQADRRVTNPANVRGQSTSANLCSRAGADGRS